MDTVGKNETMIANYIKNQLEEGKCQIKHHIARDILEYALWDVSDLFA